MDTRITIAATAVVSAGIGFAAGWWARHYKFKNFYTEKLNELENDIRTKKAKKTVNEQPKKDDEKNKSVFETHDSISKYTDILRGSHYTNYHSAEEETSGVPGEIPYKISEEEFDTLDNYTNCTLLFFPGGELTDSTFHLVDTVNDIVGRENLKKFAESGEAYVYIRNDRLHCDYEVCLEERSYAEVVRANPYLLNEDDPDDEYYEDEE